MPEILITLNIAEHDQMQIKADNGIKGQEFIDQVQQFLINHGMANDDSQLFIFYAGGQLAPNLSLSESGLIDGHAINCIVRAPAPQAAHGAGHAGFFNQANAEQPANNAPAIQENEADDPGPRPQD